MCAGGAPRGHFAVDEETRAAVADRLGSAKTYAAVSRLRLAGPRR